ncbi:hypothetical protein ACFQV5_09330 [Paenibacillus sp. GCM10028914]
MSELRRVIRLLVIAVGLYLFYPVAVFAAPVTTTESIKLSSEQYNIQIVIKGNSGYGFEANLEMPNGTIYAHDSYNANEVLYLTMDTSERIWIVNVAKPGEYKLHLKGEAQGYDISVKEEKVRPSVSWISPMNTKLTPTEGLSLSWKAAGDYTPEDSIQFYVKNTNGWEWIKLGEAPLGANEASLSFAGQLANGEYELRVIADNKTEEGQIIDPKVTIVVNQDDADDAASFQVKKVVPKGEEVEIQFELPEALVFTEALARFVPAAGEAIEVSGSSLDVYPLEQTEGSDLKLYSWTVALPEGEYKEGALQLVFDTGGISSIVQLPAFELKQRDWSKDVITWSIESEKTNAKQLQLTLELQAAAQVQVLDSADGVLFDQLIEVSSTNADVITVPLTEGDHIVTLVMEDKGGSMMTEEKRYLIDRTSPALTMIQPQASHMKLKDGIASGFTDTDVIVFYQGKEYTPDESGYFQITDVKKSLKLMLRDSHGNETSYYWEERGGFSIAWIVLISTGIILILATVIIIYRLRIKNN